MKMNFFIKKVAFMLLRCFVINFIFRPSDLITTMTYVLIDNFCNCLNIPQCMYYKRKNNNMNGQKIGDGG